VKEFTLVILQARMSSSRLPGKVMTLINGEPMIFWQIERIKAARSIDQIIVATSSDQSDDSLAHFLASKGIEVFRGSRDDVLSRFLEIDSKVQPSTIVRLTGDCPLVMPKLIDSMVKRFYLSDCDYLSNTLEPTFPDGLDVEIFQSSALKRLASFDLSLTEREHVTLGMYSRPSHFVLQSFQNDQNFSNKRWTVDYVEDLIFVTNVYKHFVGRELKFSFEDVMSVLADNPGLVSAISGERRNEKTKNLVGSPKGERDEIL
jgi:spore coat polysaccharide biosynthesis protein SpsF